MSKRFQSVEHVRNYYQKVLRNNGLNVNLENAMDLFQSIKVDASIDFFEGLGLKSLSYEFFCAIKDVDNIEDAFSVISVYHHASIAAIRFNDTGLEEDFNSPYLEVLKKEKQIYCPKLSIPNIDNLFFTDEFIELQSSAKKRYGCYKIYDINDDIIYIGKSKTLGSRIVSSINERKGSYKIGLIFTNSYSDANIIEPYIISKLHPKLNSEFKANDFPTFEIPVPKETDLVKIYKSRK